MALTAQLFEMKDIFGVYESVTYAASYSERYLWRNVFTTSVFLRGIETLAFVMPCHAMSCPKAYRLSLLVGLTGIERRNIEILLLVELKKGSG